MPEEFNWSDPRGRQASDVVIKRAKEIRVPLLFQKTQITIDLAMEFPECCGTANLKFQLSQLSTFGSQGHAASTMAYGIGKSLSH